MKTVRKRVTVAPGVAVQYRRAAKDMFAFQNMLAAEAEHDAADDGELQLNVPADAAVRLGRSYGVNGAWVDARLFVPADELDKVNTICGIEVV